MSGLFFEFEAIRTSRRLFMQRLVEERDAKAEREFSRVLPHYRRRGAARRCGG